METQCGTAFLKIGVGCFVFVVGKEKARLNDGQIKFSSSCFPSPLSLLAHSLNSDNLSGAVGRLPTPDKALGGARRQDQSHPRGTHGLSATRPQTLAPFTCLFVLTSGSLCLVRDRSSLSVKFYVDEGCCDLCFVVLIVFMQSQKVVEIKEVNIGSKKNSPQPSTGE